MRRSPARTSVVFRAHWALLVGSLAAVPSASAQVIRGLGFLPSSSPFSVAYGISEDGTTAVGWSGGRAFRWTAAGGMTDLGMLPGFNDAIAAGTNADGSSVVGSLFIPPQSYPRAFRWTSAEGLVLLGTLPGAFTSAGSGMSRDGTTIVGDSDGAAGAPGAYRWTQSDGMVSLGGLPGATFSSAAGVSGDGLVVTGYSGSTAGNRAFRWTDAGGMVDLGTLPNGTWSAGNAISADGAVVVGEGMLGAGRAAFRWSAGSGMVSLGWLPSPLNVYSAANAVSGDGSVVVGISGNASGSSDHAFLWTSSLGMVDLNTYLPTLGIDLTGWLLTSAYGVSGDGLTIVGSGVHNTVSEAWMVTLGSHCYANCDNSTTAPVLNIFDFVCFLNKFAAGDSYANCDQSTTPPTLNIQDFTCFLNRFAAGCP